MGAGEEGDAGDPDPARAAPLRVHAACAERLNDYVSTIEAIAHVPSLPEGRSFEAILAPLSAMLERQPDRTIASGATGAVTIARPPLLAEPTLVCVSGDANA